MYSPRHARPSCLPARAAVTGGLTAVLLPLALAAPALAEEGAAPSTTSTTATFTTATTAVTPIAAPAAPAAAIKDPRQATSLRMSADPTGTDGRSRISARLLAGDRPVQGEEVAVEAATANGWTVVAQLVTNAEGLAVGRLPFSHDTRVRSVFAGNASLAPQTSGEAVVRHRTPTDMRISAGETAADGRARIAVRVLNRGVAVRGHHVAVESLSGDGAWVYIGRLLTDDQGLAVGRLPFSRDTRVRSTFSGNARALPRTSPEAFVRFVTLGQRAVRIASQQAGKPYRYGAVGPNSFDCSGFTTYIYKTRLGKNIPRTSAQQAAALPRVAQSAKRPGDLLFFRTGGRVTHVGVYAGGNKMWAAPRTGKVVRLQTIYTSAYTVGRVF